MFYLCADCDCYFRVGCRGDTIETRFTCPNCGGTSEGHRIENGWLGRVFAMVSAPYGAEVTEDCYTRLAWEELHIAAGYERDDAGWLIKHYRIADQGLPERQEPPPGPVRTG